MRDVGESGQVDLTEPSAHADSSKDRADSLIVHAGRDRRRPRFAEAYAGLPQGGTIRTDVRIGWATAAREWRTKPSLVDKRRTTLDNRDEAVDEGAVSVREAWTAGTGVSTRCSDRTTLQTTRCCGLGLTRAPRRQYI